MDTRRLSTGDGLAYGILAMPVPDTDVPEDRDEYRWHLGGTQDDVRAHLGAHDVVVCPEYYGIPVAWKDGDTYRAILLQYCNVTENRTFATLDECCGWFVDTARAVAA